MERYIYGSQVPSTVAQIHFGTIWRRIVFTLIMCLSFFLFLLGSETCLCLCIKKREDVLCCHSVPYRLGGRLDIWKRILEDASYWARLCDGGSAYQWPDVRDFVFSFFLSCEMWTSFLNFWSFLKNNSLLVGSSWYISFSFFEINENNCSRLFRQAVNQPSTKPYGEVKLKVSALSWAFSFRTTI